MDSNSLRLLCDEELLLTSPFASPAPPRDKKHRCAHIESTPPSFADADEGLEEALQLYLRTERAYTPRPAYAEHLRLSSDLSTARLRAVRWIILASARHSLGYGTAFSAANYLDRFLSINCSIRKWDGWMIELLSIACLSIASKLDVNVCIPSLHDLQREDLDHLFQPCTIRRMELAVLNALDWRLTCVTPYSYVHLLTWRLGLPHSATSLTARTTELLVRALLETQMLEYSAFAIATSALRCGVAEELLADRSEAHLSLLARLIPDERADEVDRCRVIMGELVAGPLSGSWASSSKNCCCCCGPSSPVTVIPTRRRQMLDRHVDIDACFGCANPRKRKRKKVRKKRGDKPWLE